MAQNSCWDLARMTLAWKNRKKLQSIKDDITDFSTGFLQYLLN
jgi:hypothetical protein